MKFIKDLSPDTEKILERIYRQSQHQRVRQRAHSILLSFRGFRIEELMTIFSVSRRTLHYWFERWSEKKLVGLYDRTGRGRKSKLSPEQKEEIKEWVKAEPKNLNKIINRVEEDWKIKVSKDTLKRAIKELGMTWRRMKRGLAGAPLDWEYEIKLEKLSELKALSEKGEIKLKYLDEAGFDLTPSIPYGWQEKGETISLKSCRSKRLNVLGLLGSMNDLFYKTFSGKMTSELLIRFLDEFCETLTKKTVVVMDQASFHTSNAVINKLDEWKAKKLEIFWLPPYSPKLNRIEILWKFIKYEWIQVEAYKDWESLVNYVKKVLNGVGKEYAINFA